ncbi:hypothetical protein ACKLNO_09480 [Neisseriaceae bacterium B1]
MQIRFQDMVRIQQEYELNIKILDAKKEFMRQRREDIAQKQLDGNGGLKASIGNIVGKSAITASLQYQVEDYQKRALNKKIENNTFSEKYLNETSRKATIK